ncbi:LuxR C-terminal-related transcriptional regulator [Arthrobacter sp. Ld5]|uniref:helix-turn-helix transcriptional regulator n=1 Tax=Arthrobacter sp. Ld5 TaxID=649152 RepID=UPI003EBC6185
MNVLRTDILLPCRQPVLDTLLDVLRRGDRQGVLVLGEIGLGKSFLLRAVERSLPPGSRRHVVRASRALHSAPYGALDDLLAGVPARELGGPVPALRAARYRLRGPDGGSAVVLVDDAQFLDEESSYLLTQLAVTEAIRLVAFADYSLAPSSGLHGFAAEGYLDRLQLEPLTEATLGALITPGSAPAGPVPGAVRDVLRLREATGGNPMLLRALLDGAAVGEDAVPDPDLYLHLGLHLDPVRHSSAGALADLVASVLAPMPEEQRTVMDLLALAGAASAADVERLASGDAVRALVDQRFVAVHPAGVDWLTLRHGLYGDVLRATLPLGRRSLLHARFRGSRYALPPYSCHRLHHLAWALDAGAPVAAPVLLDAARVAAELGRPEAAERFLRAVPPGQGRAIAVGRAGLLTARGRPADAVQLLTGADSHADGGTEVDAGPTGPARDDAVVVQGTAAAADLARIAVVVQGAALRQRGAPASAVLALLDALPAPDAASGAVEADLLRARLHLDAGRAAEVLRSLPTDAGGLPTHPPALRAVALGLRGEALGLLGRAAEATQCTQAALETVLADPYGLAHVYEDVLTQHVLVLAHAGAGGRALAVLEQAETAVLPFRPADALRGILLVRRGDVRAGVQALAPGIQRLRRVDRQLLLPYAVGAAAWGAAVLGEVEEAGMLLREHRALRPRGRLDLGILGRGFAAAAESLELRAPQQPPLDALLAEARVLGLRACEVELLVLAVLLGAAGATDRLARAAADLPGEEALVLAEFAGAASTGDGAALGEVADRAAAVGLPLIALQAATRAWELRAESGPAAGARSLLRRLGRYGAPFVGTRFEVPGGAGRLTELTRSEAVVARRVAAGESNRDIAEALCVSVRTVEGHLHRMYVKFGLGGRADLVRELQGLGPDLLQPAP